MAAFASIARGRRESIFQINPNRPAKSNFIITDIFTNIDQASKSDLLHQDSESTVKQFLASPHVLNPTILLALILLGLFTAAMCFFIEFSIQKIQELRLFLTFLPSNEILSLGIWTFFCVTLCEISAWLTRNLSSDCQGTGIPEMKAILSGVKLQGFMSFCTFFSKLFGIILARGGGISIGKEGIIVHLSAIIAHHLSKNITLRNQFLAASVAAGIAAVFECPIGGVLYSIEVTATYYIVSKMWRAAFCAIWCSLGTIWLRQTGLVDIINETEFPELGLSLEIFNFMVLGVFSGLLGILFISLTGRLLSLKEQNVYGMLYGRYRYTFLIALLCSIFTYIAQYTRLSDRIVINSMFRSNLELWETYNLGVSLSIFIVTRFLLTSLSLSSYLPADVLYPLLAIGAVFGRLFVYFTDFVVDSGHPGIYAAVGAASLVCGVTHSISITVIIFEMTGQIHYFLPMIVSSLISYSISSYFTSSIYDTFLEIKGLPYLPSLKPQALHSHNARDIMEISYPQLYKHSSLKNIIDAVQEASLSYKRIPVTDIDGVLLFDINVDCVKDYFETIVKNNSDILTPDLRQHLNHISEKVIRRAKDTMVDDFSQNIEIGEGNEETQKFLNEKYDLMNSDLNFDDSPFCITETTPLSKVHFLFIMLGFNQVYIIRKGYLVGVITRESFTKKRKH